MSESPWDKRTIEELEAWLYGPRSLDGATRGWFMERMRHQVANRKHLGGARLLDFGCGGGVTGYQLAEAGLLVDRHSQDVGVRYYGVDGSERMLQIARRKVPLGDFMQADLANMPRPFGAFDVILLRAVLEHNREPLPILREALGALAAWGTMYIVWWNNPTYGEPIELPEAWGIPDIAHPRKPLLDCIREEFSREVCSLQLQERGAKGYEREIWIIT